MTTTRRGRPPGQKKTGGRKAGTPNKATASVKEAAQKFTDAALGTLAEIATDSEAPAAARVSASVALLDRGHGKPMQAVEVEVVDMTPARASDLDAIMRKAREQQDEIRARRRAKGMDGD